MSFFRFGLIAGLVVSASVSIVACGSSDDDAFTSDDLTGGTGGSGGTGKGGSGGTGAKDGSASGGTAGTDASAGAAGSAGQAGGGGAAGSSPDAGTGGDAQVDAPVDGAGGGSDAAPDSATCADPLGEPNDTEATATAATGVDDCDATQSATGILAGAEEDWYKYTGTDNLLACSPNAKASVDAAGAEVCVFAQCKSGTTGVTCAKGTAHTSPANRSGCCATGTAEADVTCSGIGAKNADVFVRVKQTGSACTGYKLTYSY